MSYIYVLKLESGKYYLDILDNLFLNLNEYIYSNKTIWTIIYKPIKILDIINDTDINKYVHIYMMKYGISNVRGGQYQKYKLTNDNKILLKDVINNCTDRCYICGLRGHYPDMCHIKIWNEDEKEYEENDIIFF